MSTDEELAINERINKDIISLPLFSLEMEQKVWANILWQFANSFQRCAYLDFLILKAHTLNSTKNNCVKDFKGLLMLSKTIFTLFEWSY